jgi:hypothetical protein
VRDTYDNPEYTRSPGGMEIFFDQRHQELDDISDHVSFHEFNRIPMTHLSAEHIDTINAYVSKFGLPSTQGGRNPSPSDIEANKVVGREWIKKLIATLTFHHPEGNFVRKRGDRGRPWSNESVAWLDGNKLYGIDLLTNAGVEWQTFNIGHVEDLTGQDWEKVDPVDHLNGGGATPGPLPPSTIPDDAYTLNWDVQVYIFDLFRNGIHPRDRVFERTDTGLVGDGTMTRGSLAFLFSAQLRVLVPWVQKNKRRPVGSEQWQLADAIANEAVGDYLRAHPVP